MTTAAESTQTSRQMLLRAQEIRELIRDARGAFVPDYVARILRNRYMEPMEEDAEEIALLLGELADTARRRIEEEGIEPLHDDKLQPPKLPKRERESVANLAMLLGTRSAALLFAGQREEALAVALEGVAWGRTSQDHETLALGWMALYAINERLGRWNDQRALIMHAIEEARASGIPRLVVDILLPLISYLIECIELDEAERLNLEVQSILQNDLPEEDRHPHYAVSLSHAARIARYRGHEAESIRGFRNALRWADRALFPLTRSSILSHLGSAYTHLEQHRQCIECQHEMVELADAIGVEKIKSWAYLNLAEAHHRLKEYDQAMELLDHAERYASAGSWDHISLITLKRAEVLIAAERPEDAAILCRQIIESTDQMPRTRRIYSALYMLGEIEEKCSRYENAEELYRRAVAVAAKDFPQRLSTAQVGLARILCALERYNEAMKILDAFSTNEDIPPALEAKALRLRAASAEALGDLRTVIDCERKAVDIEQELLERKAEQSLRNARIMLETDLLEREAELERERRRRLERELANAVVALGNHTRQAAAVEERLRLALAQSTSTSERAVTTALHEALLSLRTSKHPQESVHHYMSKVDEDFQQRLRQRFPGLTRKQERLCGLIRTGLDSKEIASLLDLQPEGLKALRKRLRKGLSLDQEETLERFLTDI
jgi:tetratricopeptide (TPR) repeat protein